MAFTTGTRYTLVPDVVDGLVAMFAAAAVAAAANLPPDANGAPAVLEVIDGAPTTELPPHYCLVGYNAAFATQGFVGSTGLAVEGSRTLSDVGNRQFGEIFTVWCEVSTYSGDSDPAVLARARIAAGGVVGALWATLEQDPTVRGAVLAPAYAAVTTFRWLLDRNPAGVAATVQFGVGIIGELWVPR